MRGLPPSLIAYTLNSRGYTPGEILSLPGVFKLTATFDPQLAYQEVLRRQDKGQGSLGGGNSAARNSTGAAGASGVVAGDGDGDVADLYVLSDDDDDIGVTHNHNRTTASTTTTKGVVRAGGGSLGGGAPVGYPLRDEFGWLSPLNYEGGPTSSLLYHPSYTTPACTSIIEYPM